MYDGARDNFDRLACAGQLTAEAANSGEQGPNWGVNVVEDSNLLTDQNPASSAALADAVIAALR
jgi:putative intracellular protease/amidase